MSNTPGAQARASTHAGRNRPSDIDELRDNIADIAGGVGDMANRAYDVATDAVEETGQIIRRNPLASIGVGLGVGFLLGLILTGGRTQRA